MNTLYDRESNIYFMSLSELKTLLYSGKKVSEESKQIIKNIINDKINNSFKKIINNSNSKVNLVNNLVKDQDSDESTDSLYSSNSSDNYDNQDHIFVQNANKLYNKSDRKGENQKVTQSSQKLFDRMISEAQVINNSYTNNINHVISRPFSNTNNQDIFNTNKLGVRRNINK